MDSGLSSTSPDWKLADFFNSSGECSAVKLEICEIGMKMWEKNFVDGNGGNIVVRVGSDLFLCSRTMRGKGDLTPEDMCLVDSTGRQLGGTHKRTSEVFAHLGIMNNQPLAQATIHCHPHGLTAFAMAHMVPPTGHLPEYEVFASTGLAPYATPGTEDNGRAIAPVAEMHNIIIMASHGVITWGDRLELAYWLVEIGEAYCNTLKAARQLGITPKPIPDDEIVKLLVMKKGLKIPDPRIVSLGL